MENGVSIDRGDNNVNNKVHAFREEVKDQPPHRWA
jgi:hypothetical protein